MPTLNWIGKEAVVNHDKEVPFRLLKKIKAHSVGDNSQNLIIHGDNLEALKALMPYYQGQIKCIYIDPPYNTGNEGWVYNDKVNSPKIKKWLGKVVGGEAEDLCRHDKWSCMIYPRLKLLKDLLSDDGLIFVSMGDDEIQTLKMIMDEIFGNDNFIAQMIWNTEGSTDNTLEIKIVHEYVLIYVKNIKSKKHAFESVIAPDITEGKLFKPNIENTATKNGKANPPSEILLPKGFPSEIEKVILSETKVSREFFKKVQEYNYIPRELTQQFDIHYPIRKDTMNIENYALKKPCTVYSGWANLNKLKKFIKNDCKPVKNDKEGDFSFYISKKGVLIYKKERKNPKNILSVIRDVGTTTQSKNQLEDMGIDFDYPKPVDLILYLIKMSTRKNSIILDSFAGSGTTGHAILDLNKEDDGNRKFILVEMEDKVAKDITAERVKQVINKNDYKDGFEFCELDKPLFNEEGQIEEECSFAQLATYIYFTETNTNLDLKVIDKQFIGEYNETEFYLLFKEKGKNILNKDFLKKINKNTKKKVIYADKCLIDDAILEKFRIQFKQIPYEVKVY